MDGQATPCVRCGAPLSGGRFCTNCGAPVSSVAALPPDPVYDDAGTRERVYAVPDEPAFIEPRYDEPVYDQPDYATSPVYAEPPPPRRSPGAGLWIGAAAGLVAVLLLGTFLLLSGGGGDDSPSASSTPLVPKPQQTDTAAPKPSKTTSAPTTAPATTATGAPADVAGLAQASAPSHASAGVDFSGQPVTFIAPNMVDGIVETCWRTPGDATGTVLTFRLDQPTQLTKVGLINGYAKTAFSGGRSYDWYQGDRRVLSVDWIFDDGTTVSQLLSDTRAMQTRSIPPVTTSTVQVRITSVSPPGRGPASRNDTAVSEVSLVGSPA